MEVNLSGVVLHGAWKSGGPTSQENEEGALPTVGLNARPGRPVPLLAVRCSRRVELWNS